MPDPDTPNLPILDDIIKPGNAGKAQQRPSRKPQETTPVVPRTEKPESTDTLPGDTPPPHHKQPEIVEPFIEDVITSYRPNIDSLTEEILASIMKEMEPLIREQIRQGLKRHFPDS